MSSKVRPRRLNVVRGFPLQGQSSLVRGIVALAAMVVFSSLFVVDSGLDLQIWFANSLIVAVVAFPLFFRRSASPVEPITMFVPLLLFGVSLKLSILLFLGFDHPRVANFLLFGRPPVLLLNGVVAFLLAVTAFVLGYMLVNRPLRIQLPRSLTSGAWDVGRMRFGIFVVGALSAVASLILIQRFGVTSLSTLSAKRFNDLDGNAQARFTTANYWLFRIALLGRFSLYLWVPYSATKKGLGKSISTFALVVVAVFPVILINNRAGVGLILADLLLIRYFVKGRLQLSTTLVGGLVGLVSVVALLSSRSGTTSVSSLVEATFLGRDFLDISKTGQIVTHGDAGVVGGETYVGWLFTLVPSSAWEDPPLFARLGRLVWGDVYGGGGINGVPAGLVGEAYLNFGWIGIALVPLLLGIATRKVYLTFESDLKYYGAAMIYSVVAIRFGIFSWSNDIGTGILKAGLDALPLFLLIRFLALRSVAEESHGDSGPVGSASAVTGSVP